MSRLVIIGAGHGGSHLAISAREEGFSGTITLIDLEPALPYHKPPLSKTFLKNKDAEAQPLRAAQSYQEAGIERLCAKVVSLNGSAKTIVLSTGATLAYDNLVLATGAKSRTLQELAGAENVYTLRALDDAIKLRSALENAEKIVIIGGGFIGLETAAALASLGKQVTVVETQQRILARVASSITSDHISKHLEAVGVTLKTGWQSKGFERDGNRIIALLGEGIRLEADLIVVGIGATPNVALAEQAGLDCKGGIITNEMLQTSVPHIYALGDCAMTPHWQTGHPERIESVQNATDQARFLAGLLAKGEAKPYRAVPWFWSDIGSLKLQIAGLSAGANRMIMRHDGDKLAVFHLKDNTLVAVETLNSAADHMVARRLLEAGQTPQDAHMLEGVAKLKTLL